MSALATTPDGTPPAPHPNFNHPDSDVTLRSSDNILFLVHKANLCSASLVFKDMFLVGSPDQSPSSDPIVLSEPAAALELLLAICYPREEPIDFAKVDNVLLLDCYEMSVKYGMWIAGFGLRSYIEPLISTDPFRVIRVAHRLSDSIMLARAVEASLKTNILVDTETLCAKTGPLWPNLIEYHFRYRQEVVSTLFEALDLAYTHSGCRHCQSLGFSVLQVMKSYTTRGYAAFPKDEMVQALGPNITGCSNAERSRLDALRTFEPKAVFKPTT